MKLKGFKLKMPGMSPFVRMSLGLVCLTLCMVLVGAHKLLDAVYDFLRLVGEPSAGFWAVDTLNGNAACTA